MSRALRAAAGLVEADEARVHGELEEPAEVMNTRPNRGGLMGRTRQPDPKADEQYDSYRGTIYAVTTKIADRFARVETMLQQVEVPPEDDAELQRFPVDHHPFLSLLGEGVGCAPNDEDSVYEFKKAHQLSMDLTGEAFWLAERTATGVPSKLSLLPSNRMKLVIDKDDGSIAGYLFQPRGVTGTQTGGFQSERGHFIPRLPFPELRDEPRLPFVVHYRYPSPRGIEDPRGWSPVKSAALAHDINQFELTYKREFLKNGAQLGGVLQSEMPLDKSQIREYTEQFKELHQGAQKAGLPLVLPKFMSWETTEPTPKDAQWVETVNLTKQEILQIYATSETQLGQADVGSRATSDVQEAIFARDVIQPRIVGFEQKLEGAFLPIYPEQTDRLYFDIVHENPVPEDRKFQLEREEADVAMGLRTRNEIRDDRGLEPFGRFGELVDSEMNTMQVDPWEGGENDDGDDDLDDLFPAPDDEDGDDGEGEEEDGDDETSAADRRRLVVKGVRVHLRWEEAEARWAAPPPPAGAGDDARALSEPDAHALVESIFGQETEEEVLASLRPLLESVIREEGKLGAELVDGDFESFDPNEVAQEYLRVGENRIKGIGKTTASEVRSAMIIGIDEGEGIRTIAGRVREKFTDAKTWRAQAIARTEVIGAHNQARVAGYKQAGAGAKEWLATLDGNVRASHAAASGQIVLVNDTFTVGGYELNFPGDPAGPAAEVINCRCTTLPAKKTDMEGRVGEPLVTDDQVRQAVARQFAAKVDRWLPRFRRAVRQVHDRWESVTLQQLAAMASLQEPTTE